MAVQSDPGHDFDTSQVQEHSACRARSDKFRGVDRRAAEMPDRFVSNEKTAAIPPSQRKSIDVTKLDSILNPQEKASGADAIESKAATKAVATEISEAAYEEELEMDFPARIINIKIENDQLRARLDKLE
jgi:hypothetical protein